MLANAAIAEELRIRVKSSFISKSVNVSIEAGDLAATVALKIVSALEEGSEISQLYAASADGADIMLTQRPGHEAQDSIQVSLLR